MKLSGALLGGGVAVVMGLTLTAPDAAEAQCTFRIDLPAHASIATSVTPAGDGQQTRETRYSTGASARGAGKLELMADGSYRISGYLGLPPVRTGRWRANQSADFGHWGGLELVDVRGEGYSERNWYIYRNERGEVVGREPPYTGYNDLRLTSLSGGDGCVAGAGAPPAAPAVAQASAPVGTAAAPAAQTGVGEWGYEALKTALLGKSPDEVRALIGEPSEVSMTTWVYTNLTIRDAMGNIGRRAHVQFQEHPRLEVYEVMVFR